MKDKIELLKQSKMGQYDIQAHAIETKIDCMKKSHENDKACFEEAKEGLKKVVEDAKSDEKKW